MDMKTTTADTIRALEARIARECSRGFYAQADLLRKQLKKLQAKARAKVTA